MDKEMYLVASRNMLYFGSGVESVKEPFKTETVTPKAFLNELKNSKNEKAVSFYNQVKSGSSFKFDGNFYSFDPDWFK